MDAVHQEREVDSLRRLTPVGNYRSCRSPRDIRVGRIMAQYAVFGLIALSTVKREGYVALIALGGRHYFAAWLNRRAVYRKSHDLICGADLHAHFLSGPGQQCFRAPRFHTN